MEQLLNDLFSIEYYIYWVEVFVIIAILLFVIYVAYNLNLFKRK